MSEAQPATPEQEAQAVLNAALKQAQQQAYQDAQNNVQIEIQMRVQALGAAVNASNPDTAPIAIAETAKVFLEFLKKGEVTNV